MHALLLDARIELLLLVCSARLHVHLPLQMRNRTLKLLVVPLQLVLQRLHMQLLPEPAHKAIEVGVVRLEAGVQLREGNGG